MPNYLHRTTKQYLTSVSTPDLREPEANYVKDPDLRAVQGQPVKYWVITGDLVTLASRTEQTAIDAAEATARTKQLRDNAVALLDSSSPEGFIARVLVLKAGFTVQSVKDDINAGLAD